MNRREERLMSGDKAQEDSVQAAVKPVRPNPEPPGELETLFQVHHHRVFSAAYRITGSVADAEDVLQTVFLRLARAAGQIPSFDNPEAYLSRAAINAALDVMRNKKRLGSVGLDEMPQELVASKLQSPEKQHADRELQTLIRQAVARLGSTAATMFILRYYEGCDNREVARRLGTSPLVVGVVLHRARTKLRKEIRHYLERHHEKQ
jgi:RNA polymerase sigma-70 factor, ECF subfamily